MYSALFIGVCCAVLFFRAADYERMNPWLWTLVSIGLTGISAFRSTGLVPLLLMQAVLFGLMWWNNMSHQRRKPG